MANQLAPRPRRRRQSGHSTWAVLAFLVGFTLLLIFICYWYLFPALRAAADATEKEKRALSAHAALLLSVTLFILLAGILLTFRIGRYFFPRPTPKRERTKYVDAWAEAGRRMETPERPRPDEDA
jgi:formate hydrogenlyase subunit 3/multisubunit Na+/H+ antiporter MnhD subunit